MGTQTELPAKVNLASGATIPSDFIFIEFASLETDGGESNGGCSCTGGCSPSTCSCAQQNPLGQLLNAQSLFIPLLHGVEIHQTLYECGPGCGCKGHCSSIAITLKPLPHRLTIGPAAGKDLAVFATENIPKGAYVCQYAGEYVSAAEARQRLLEYDRRGEGHALLVVREVLPSGTSALRTQIDATKRSNVARFINHR